VLGPADERLVRRIVLVDNRRAVLSTITYNDVDLIAAEPRILDCGVRRDRQLRPGQLCRWAEKVVDVFLHVAFDGRRKFFEHLRCQHLAVPLWCQSKTHWRAQQCDVLRFCALL
jgi:hypothetical protein